MPAETTYETTTEDDENIVPQEQEEEEQTAAAPKRRGPGRPRKGSSPDITEEEAEKWDYDTWLDRWDWDQPGFKCKVERKSPVSHGKVPTAGVLGSFDNKPLREDEIRQQFGGGTYQISVIGPRPIKGGGIKIMRLSHKMLIIPGPPRTDNLGYIDIDEAPPPGRSSGYNQDPLARMASEQMTHMQRRADMVGQQSAATIQLASKTFQDAAEMKSAAADKIIAEKDRLLQTELKTARERVEDARREADGYRQEKDKALEEMRRLQNQFSSERQAMEDAATKKIESIHSSSNSFLGTIIPQIQTSAQNQINQAYSNAQGQISVMMQMFEGRLTSAEHSYQSRLQNLESANEQRLAAQSDLYKSQMETAKQLAYGQIKHLELELQTSRAREQQLQLELSSVRDRLMEEISKFNKQVDPETQMLKLGNLMETIKSITGAGEQQETTITTGNPLVDAITQNLGKVVEIIPHVTQAWTAKSQADAIAAQAASARHQPAPPPPQMQQMQLPPHQPPPQQPPQQQQMPQRPPVPRRRRPQKPELDQRGVVKKRSEGTIPREELDKAVLFINAALTGNPELSPADFARSAQGSVPSEMLRILSRPKAEDVVDDLEKKGVLHGVSSTENGKRFLIEVLNHLRATMQ